MPKKSPASRFDAPGHPPATTTEYRGVRSLHLGTSWVQGAMRLAKPDHIELEYVQMMMILGQFDTAAWHSDVANAVADKKSTLTLDKKAAAGEASDPAAPDVPTITPAEKLKASIQQLDAERTAMVKNSSGRKLSFAGIDIFPVDEHNRHKPPFRQDDQSDASWNPWIRH